ncbi:hypothetical protein GGR50DRAFT_672215 [Xylaria sp. CBS 124048]|nr:hypothetical protein GGR50DRAFT_672215 [Xylaria sp. CBS 124048]
MGWNQRGWRLPHACRQQLGVVVTNLRKRSIWLPMLKKALSTTIVIIIAVVPAIVKVYGKFTFLGVIASVFGQPGHRFGKMIESVSSIALGTLLGLGWSNLGLYLSSLVVARDTSAAWAIRAIFFTCAVIIHGVLRSSAPRLFVLIFFFFLMNLTILTNPEKTVTLSAFKEVIYPVFTAIAVIFLVNVLLLPQFASSYLGACTIETLTRTIDSFQMAGDWFMSQTEAGEEEKTPQEMRTRLTVLADEKPKLRACLVNCKTAQAESNFELVLTVLPPSSLKPISVTMMTRLVQITISLINACESKSTLARYDETKDAPGGPDDERVAGSRFDVHSTSHDESTARRRRGRGFMKPVREIESSDIDTLEHIMSRIRQPAKDMYRQIREAVLLTTSALAYCYDISRSAPSPPIPFNVSLTDMDGSIEKFTRALATFNVDSAAALEIAAVATDGRDSIGHDSTRMETHLAASFLISISQTAKHVLEILRHTRTLVEMRQNRHDRRHLHWPRLSWKKWLVSGGEQDGNVLPENARKEARTGYGIVADGNGEDESADDGSAGLPRSLPDEESNWSRVEELQPQAGQRSGIEARQRPPRSNTLRIRGVAADAVEFFLRSDHLGFALKMTIAALLVTFPAFIPSLNNWYVSVRAIWATLQLVLLFEVSIGTSIRGILVRALGAIYGCTVGLIAWEIGQGNLVVLVVILAIGLLPAAYIQVATSYVKVGFISMISLSIVGISTVVRTNNHDLPWQIYLKRLLSFLVGGSVGVLVQMILFPIRARDRLVESLASTISQVSIMQSGMAVGVDSPSIIDTKSQVLESDIEGTKEKAQQALDAARTFLPFTLTEPRIKGSFKEQALIYGEMINVLFQIIERMDNMLHIRKLFGSTVLEELHAEILPYRRNVAGSITLTLFAVQEALVTKLPLPQFLPSSRVALLRYVTRTRELMLARKRETSVEGDTQAQIAPADASTAHDDAQSKLMVRLDFLAWKATSAGMMEIVEYLDELVNLAKLLARVNACHGASLERPILYRLDVMRRHKSKAASQGTTKTDNEKVGSNQARVERRRSGSLARQSSVAQTVTGLRRRPATGASAADTGDSTMDSDENTEEENMAGGVHRATAERNEASGRLTRTESEDSNDTKRVKAVRSLDDVP